MPSRHRSWPRLALGEVAQVRTGIAKGPRLPDRAVHRPYLRVANVQDGRLDLSEIKTIAVDERDVARYELRKGDVLMTEGGDFDKLGRGTVWRGEIPGCLHQNHVFAVHTDVSRLLPEFLALLSESYHGKRYFLRCSKQSTNLASINSSQLRRFPVLLPPIGTQSQIVAVYRASSSRERFTANLLEAKRRLKRALLQQVLTGKRRFANHRDEWIVTRLGALGTFTRGVSYDALLDMRSAADSRSVVLLRAGNLQAGTFETEDAYLVDADRCKPEQVLRLGDVAICMSNGTRSLVGKASQVIAEFPRDTTVGAFCSIFRPHPGVDPSFIGQLFQSPQYAAWMSRVLAGSAINNLRSDDIAALGTRLPKSTAEQRAIASVLRVVDGEIALLDRQLAALRKLKHGLMQKLLTGELEVPAARSNEEREVSA